MMATRSLRPVSAAWVARAKVDAAVVAMNWRRFIGMGDGKPMGEGSASGFATVEILWAIRPVDVAHFAGHGCNHPLVGGARPHEITGMSQNEMQERLEELERQNRSLADNLKALCDILVA